MDITALYYINASILGGGAFLFFILSLLLIKPYKKVFLLMIAVPCVATIAYLGMAQGIGIVSTGIDEGVNVTRYIDWFITTPILLFILAYAMIPEESYRWRTFFLLAGLDIIMLLTGLASEFFTETLRSILFGVSGIAYLFMVYIIIDRLLKMDRVNLPGKLRRTALYMAWVILILWSIYPFIWLFGTKGIVLMDMYYETIAYMVLDVLTKLGFTALLLRFLQLQLQNKTKINE